MTSKPLVIYHGNCLDGFTAAWACWLQQPEADFVPGFYGQEPPDVTDREVFLLDFSYKFNVMLDLYHNARSITVLDHHKTAEAELAAMLNDGWLLGEFDMNKSGARLAWEWFQPNTDVPLLVQLVEDRDLWRFAIPHSKEINAALFSYAYDFNMWSNLKEKLETCRGYDNLLNAGRAIERKQAKDVDELVAKLRRQLIIGGYKVWAANLPYTLASDAAHLMCYDYKTFAATYYVDAEGRSVFSLRSKEDGMDVSEVAKLYGGGGHKHAAGFTVKTLLDLLG